MQVEYAQQDDRGIDALTRSLSRANPAIVKAVNARRRQLGLAEIRTAGDPLAPLVRRTCSTAASSARRWAAIRHKATAALDRLRHHRS